MKVVHLKKENDPTVDTGQHIKLLEAIIKAHPGNEKAHDRLMILYRKQGNYKQELKTLNRAIKTFEELFTKKQPAVNNKIKALSMAIAKSTGLSDKKGNSIFQKGELAKWKRRREVVIKKIK
ncbi:MAG TPA: bacterial transcriptional activator domain-containing protein [Chitinophagaceae bacterium]|nr:bacterial transcriptional activator domain-containing protein [Chitinophagaceae bacterium]